MWKGRLSVPSNKPIGILDSGFGGLTVVSEVIRQLPQENIMYVGDNARCPYGSRQPKEVRQFLFEIMDFLVAQDVKMILIACNTATAVGLDGSVRTLSDSCAWRDLAWQSCGDHRHEKWASRRDRHRSNDSKRCIPHRDAPDQSTVERGKPGVPTVRRSGRK